MRVAVCGRNLEDLVGKLNAFPVETVETRPDVVISYGGDGSLLGAERDFPGVPKCPIRDSRSCPKCDRHGDEAILDRLVRHALSETRIIKLQATREEGEFVAGINDVIVNKEQISSAVRYRLWIDGELYKDQIVGDGLVIATPFGSTGYYRSITHSSFRVGMGLAFNNSTEPLDHLVISDGSVVELEIIRGPAVLLADNDPKRIPLAQQDRVRVTKSDMETVVLGLDIFRCEECYRLRQGSDAVRME